MTSTTLLACTVVNTRWPVSADWMAICAVSRVADLAHHDLVRVVAQDGAQAAREGQAFLLVDRNLRDAANLVFDRVLDGDDLVLVGLDLGQRGVQRGGLAAAGRAGDQHHAVRLGDVAAEAAQVVVVEAHHVQRELVELLAHRLLVEHAQHRILAVDAGHDGDAEVDGAVACSVTRKRPSCGTRRSAMSSSDITLTRERMVEWCSRAMGGMAGCSTPSMRYFT